MFGWAIIEVSLGYVELRAHSAFSFGDGAVSPEKLVERAASLGYAALGLTDHADVGGVIRFTLEAMRAGIKPIGGAELEVDGFPTGFLATNEIGYRNLAYLVTRSRLGQVRDWEGAPPSEMKQRTSSAPISGSRGRGHDLSRKYAVNLPPRGRPTLTWLEVA